MSYRKVERVEKWSGSRSVDLIYQVGNSGVKEIGEHLPMGPGDVCFYDIFMTDGGQVRVFYPDVVSYTKLITLETPSKPSIIT